ncbi:MAG: class I SAM-dependent methyltransferase [Candidatus Hinthialibacter antarcticus]|nr:class I SAM-dependent methyltransferase [Candidatus Hinthialibacter antarcticus]
MPVVNPFPSEESADWSERFFNHPDYLDIYSEMTGPSRTKTELAFCRSVLTWKIGDAILDAPCGAGRHTTPLAHKGHDVTGLDLSGFLLREAKQTALKGFWNRNQPRFVQGVMQQLPFGDNQFDHVINLFSSFGYLDTEAENFLVMQEYARVLRPGGKLLIDVMNRHFIVPRLNEEFESVHANGLFVREERAVINDGRRMHNAITVTDDQGNRRCYLYRPWLYNGAELSAHATNAGLIVESVYGDFKGRLYKRQSERAILVAVKPLPHVGE